MLNNKIHRLLNRYLPKMVCRNICERLGGKPNFEYNQYILLARNIVEDVRFTFTILVCFVHAVLLRRTPSNRKEIERIRRQRKMKVVIHSKKEVADIW